MLGLGFLSALWAASRRMKMDVMAVSTNRAAMGVLANRPRHRHTDAETVFSPRVHDSHFRVQGRPHPLSNRLAGRILTVSVAPITLPPRCRRGADRIGDVVVSTSRAIEFGSATKLAGKRWFGRAMFRRWGVGWRPVVAPMRPRN